jgi:hypothetical protein
MQPVFPMKNRDLQHYANNVFFGGGRLQDFPGPFEFWTFIFVHFRGAMPFLFTCFLRVIE